MLRLLKRYFHADLRLRLQQVRPQIRNARVLLGDTFVFGLRKHRSHSAAFAHGPARQDWSRRPGVREDGLLRWMLARILRLITIIPENAEYHAVALREVLLGIRQPF